MIWKMGNKCKVEIGRIRSKLELAVMMINAQSRLEWVPNRTQRRLRTLEFLFSNARD